MPTSTVGGFGKGTQGQEGRVVVAIDYITSAKCASTLTQSQKTSDFYKLLKAPAL